MLRASSVFFRDTAPTQIYTLSLHDALPISEIAQGTLQAIFEFQTMICELTGMEVANASMYDGSTAVPEAVMMAVRITGRKDRKSTRLNSSHTVISYAVFCLKKKREMTTENR